MINKTVRFGIAGYLLALSTAAWSVDASYTKQSIMVGMYADNISVSASDLFRRKQEMVLSGNFTGKNMGDYESLTSIVNELHQQEAHLRALSQSFALAAYVPRESMKRALAHLRNICGAFFYEKEGEEYFKSVMTLWRLSASDLPAFANNIKQAASIYQEATRTAISICTGMNE